ncbi:hypothetical protein Tco_0233662 [Tanacetum coccineum]
MFEQNSSLESENCCLKKTVTQFQKDFSKIEAHFALELKCQNQSSQSRQNGQFFQEKSKDAKVKHDIDVIETINIDLEHSAAKLLIENEHLNNDNEHLKQTYEDLYDSIKKAREMVFAIAALKNELRKSKGNSVDTKFAKPLILGKPPLQPLKNQSVNGLSKPVTLYYWPKVKELAFTKPHHVIASRKSRNSSKNLPRFSSNDMVHNHYLEEATKKIQERDRNSKPSMMYSARLPNTANGSKPKPRSTNKMTRNWPTYKSSCVTKTDVPKAEHSRNSSSFSDSKHLVCSICQNCVFNANHDACITKLLKEVNSRTKVQSHKTTKRYIPVAKKGESKKPKRRIFIRQKFFLNKTIDVYVKTTPPRFGLTWKPTGRIFTSVGLTWILTGNTVGTCLNTNDSAIPLGKETCSPNTLFVKILLL